MCIGCLYRIGDEVIYESSAGMGDHVQTEYNIEYQMMGEKPVEVG